MNDNMRKGGFSPSQWVLGKYPRRPGASNFDEDEFADLGIVSDRFDPASAFQLKTKIRLPCKRDFAAEDCSTRVAKSMLRKAAPMTLDYAVGDLISFKRKQGAGTTEELWSPATRIIGFDGDKSIW